MGSLAEGVRSVALGQIEANSSRCWNRQTVPKGELRSKSYMHFTELGHITVIVSDVLCDDGELRSHTEVIDNRQRSGGPHRRFEVFDGFFVDKPDEDQAIVVEHPATVGDFRAMEPGELEEMLKYTQTLDHAS